MKGWRAISARQVPRGVDHTRDTCEMKHFGNEINCIWTLDPEHKPRNPTSARPARAVSQRRGINLKRFKDCPLKTKARIRP